MLHISRYLPQKLFLLIFSIGFTTACGNNFLTFSPTATPARQTEIVVITPTPEPTLSPTPPPLTGDFRPHPILSNNKVRQAIAYCLNRPQLIEKVYPFLPEKQQNLLLQDTFLPKDHWATTTGNITSTTYSFLPEKGKQLLEAAGWQERFEGQPRLNNTGQPLALTLVGGDSEFAQTLENELEKQLFTHCGIQIIRSQVPASLLFGKEGPLEKRTFELATFAWLSGIEPYGQTLYACNQIPNPANNLQGQNYGGWCNSKADKAVITANNTLDRQKRKEAYAILQQEFANDMISLPLFRRFALAAATPKLLNFKPDATESSYTANIAAWQMKNERQSLVLGMLQEPKSLFSLEDASIATSLATDLLTERAVTSFAGNYQAVALNQMPSLDNGLAKIQTVRVKPGEVVWSTKNQTTTLNPGVQVINSNGEPITYTEGPIDLPQLQVTFEMTQGLKWEDGTPVTKADFALAYEVNCHSALAAANNRVCASIQKIDFMSDLSYIITYLPGALWTEYFLPPFGHFVGTQATLGAYPAHREVDYQGKKVKLADLPLEAWNKLSEITEKPLSYGPYKLVEWRKGQRMIFEANPFYYKGALALKVIVLQFFANADLATTQLLLNNIDVLGPEALNTNSAMESLFAAEKSGQINLYPFLSMTWEHLDMNLFSE